MKFSKHYIYNDTLLSKLINYLMIDGKKSTSEKILRKCLNYIKKVTEQDPIKMVYLAVQNVQPKVALKSIRKGGMTYKIPMELSIEKQQSIALKWIIRISRGNKSNNIDKTLAKEIIDSFNMASDSYKRKKDLHKLAESNRAYSHYRW